MKNILEFLFSFALFFNAVLFVPQAIKIFRDKAARDVSIITFAGFLLIQLATILHGVIHHDYLLVWGYVASILTCGCVVIGAVLYRKAPMTSTLTNELSITEILDQIPGHVYWKDKNGICQGCNTINWHDFGLKSLSEFIGKSDFDLFKHEEAEKLVAVDKEVMRNNTMKVAEEVITNKQGIQTLYLSHKSPLKNKKGEIVGTIGVSVDITKAKQQVEDRLAMLEDIIAVMPGNVYWMDIDGTYLGCNNNEAQAVGLRSRKDIVGKRNIDIGQFVIPEVLDPINISVMHAGETVIVEEPAVLRDGAKAIFLSHKVPLHNAKSEIIGMVGISIDITERKQQEHELQIAKEKAESANKAKSEFLAVVSHELRTPLTGIIGMIDILRKDHISDQRSHEYLDSVDTASKHLLGMINNILDFAKLEEHKFHLHHVPFDLKETLHQVTDILGAKAQEKHLQLTINCDREVPTYLMGDPKALLQILLNVIGNAIKFTEQGDVAVNIHSHMMNPNQVELEVAVTDHGIGIPADKLDKIFDRFEQVDSSPSRAYGGTGLGLSVTKKLIDLMGGLIIVKSDMGKGSTFFITIKFALAAAAQVHPVIKNLVITPTIQKACSVLLVEDDPLIQFVHKHKLESMGCDVVVAQNGEEAFTLSQSQPFTIIFMDIGLPETSGNDVIRQIRAQEKNEGKFRIPIVALTAYSDQENRTKSLEAGADFVLSKPVDDEQLFEILKRT